MAKEDIIHGTAVEVYGYGIVITGGSGSGKSELCLKLIDRGHKFISDDHVLLISDNDGLWIHGHENHFMHLGGVGFVDMLATYGENALAMPKTRCNLFIQLENSQLDFNIRIAESLTQITVLGQKVPHVVLYVAPNRPLDLLVEILVKKQQQLDKGYNANEAFIDNLKQISKL